MPYNKYLQISKERYDVLCERYKDFTESVGDVNTKPVKIFDKLSEKHMQELLLIREVSQDLQKKRDEDIRKAAEQAAEAEQKAKEAEAAAKEAEAAAKEAEAAAKEAAAKEAEAAAQEAQAATEATPAEA